MPSPPQFSHLPPEMLNENLPAVYPLAYAYQSFANSSLIGVKTPVYVAGLLRGVRPIGD